MNNTKWREVLTLLAEFDIPVQFAFSSKFEFGLARHVPQNGLRDTGTKDWGGGPVEYKEIFAVRWSRFQNLRDPITGRVSKDEVKSNAVLAELAKLGQLPLEVENEYVTIYGHRESP